MGQLRGPVTGCNQALVTTALKELRSLVTGVSYGSQLQAAVTGSGMPNICQFINTADALGPVVPQGRLIHFKAAMQETLDEEADSGCGS